MRYFARAVARTKQTVLSPQQPLHNKKGRFYTETVWRRDHSSTILHLDALLAIINFGVSFNFDDVSSRNHLILKVFTPCVWLTDKY